MTEAVVVTGASSGIGAAIAIEFATHGVPVACLSRRALRPPGAPAHLEDLLVPIECDVADEASRAHAVEVARAIGPLTGLVNAAGFQMRARSELLDLDDMRSILETNLIGSVRMAQLLFPDLKAAPHGTVVNIGSFFGRVGAPGFLAYSASKAGLEGATRTLGVEWAPHGISVITVAPGYVTTGLNAEYLESAENRDKLSRMIPTGKIGTPEEIGRLVVAIVRARVSFLTAETIYVDGAQGVSL